MNIEWNTTCIDPKELIHISRGNKQMLHKYLILFQELIPQRIESLVESLEAEDRKMIRQILHKMSPQLQFFGIKDIVQPIRRLELEYETMPLEELHDLVDNILITLDLAIKDVVFILKEHF